MFRNYLLTALRNFARHKLYSFINIAGLAVGLACVIFITLFIRDELSYDKWIPDTENLYLVHGILHFPGQGNFISGDAPFPVTVAMAAQIPEVTAQTHLMSERRTIGIGNRQFSELVDVVDSNFFRVLRLPLVEGTPASVFAQPESAVLSQAQARKYFGSQDPVDKTIMVDGVHPLTVTGVMRDLPHNTQLVADIAIPNTSRADDLSSSQKTDGWLSFDSGAFVRLAPGASPATVIRKLAPILDKDINVKKHLNVELPGGKVLDIALTRFTDVHMTADLGMTPSGSWTVVYGFGAIALLILLIACFNFTNLATARAMIRAREVSLRKVMGARRLQLIAQFLGESVLTAILALALALALVEILLPAYDAFLGRPITLDYRTSGPLLAQLAGVAVVTGLIAGIYPALVLSGFRPAATLRSGVKGASGSGLLRTGLVVLQFAISIGLGVAALVVFAQVRYAQHVDLGFARDGMVIVSDTDKMTPATRHSFTHALAANAAIEGVGQSSGAPFVDTVNMGTFNVPGGAEHAYIRLVDASPDLPKLYNMRLVSGRWLSLGRGNDINTGKDDPLQDGRNVLLSESAAQRLGWTAQTALGKSIVQTDTGKPLSVTVVGVMADVLMDGVRSHVQPTMLLYNPNGFDTFAVRVKAGELPQALAAIDSTWHRFASNVAIRRRFLGDMFDRLLVADRQQGAMFGLFVGIAIFIACLGLFGLAAFTAERRTKEIGIRKTFGARTRDIVWLLLWQFSIPVLIANVVAWPIAWFYLHRWLESYAYRITLNPLYFGLAGVTALAIAWVTVFAHALRVARSNPVHALRYE
ncbi:MAG TPA: ABC transporter permease [Rhizomicrobium sp.]|jgi:putative ABC transport system permease protein